MRRCIAILLLALLPIQFSWAVAAAYCGHEIEQQAQHLGHHEHQHAGQTSAQDEGTSVDRKAPIGYEFDCGHCHGACAAIPALAAGIAPLSLASRPLMPDEGIPRTLAQSPPERPQWAPLA